MSTLYSIGAMNQLSDALERAGFTNDDVTRLKQYKELGKLRYVLSGKASIAYPEHLIDTDAAPYTPEGWAVVRHFGHGLWEWNVNAIKFLSEELIANHRHGVDIQNVIEALVDRVALNANVLDYLLAHPELIPEDWNGKSVFFWGTIYRRLYDGRLFVRYLCSGNTGIFWLGLDLISIAAVALIDKR